MIVETLRAETKKAHADLDHSLYPYILGTTTIYQYHKLLNVFYGYFQPLQQQLDFYLNDEIIPGYSGRRKPNWIMNDIKVCGLEWNQPLLCTTIPVIHSYEQAMGAYYVLEGSTMGGTIITKKLKDQLHIDEKALSFFKGYGENNTSMWKEFLNILNQVDETLPASQELIKTAKECFSTFKKWIDEQYS